MGLEGWRADGHTEREEPLLAHQDGEPPKRLALPNVGEGVELLGRPRRWGVQKLAPSHRKTASPKHTFTL